MKKKYRIIYAFILVVVFIIVAPLLVLYATGYRYNFSENRVIKTGVLAVDSDPRNAQITINDKKAGSRTPTVVKNLFPGDYSVSIEKEGYFGWEKSLSVFPNRSTSTERVSLLKSNSPTLVTEEKVSNIIFSPNDSSQPRHNDLEMARALYESVDVKENVVLLPRFSLPREVKGMLGELDLFISTRMHIAILATMIGTPTITINTQPKLFGYMEMINQQERSCEIADFTIERARELVEDTLANSEQIRLDLENARKEIGERARMASELLKEVYNRKRKNREG